MKIKISDIRKSFGGKEVLKGVSFSAKSGDCIGILGANGSGKSTLLSILAGVSSFDSGTLDFSNEKICYVPQENPLVEELSAKDNLRLWYKKEDLKRGLENGILKELGISSFLKKPAGKLSGGMKKRLSIGCALASKSQIMLLDESSSALDLSYKEKILSFYKNFAEQGGIIILATHDIQEIQICTKCLLMQDGLLSECAFDLHSESGLKSLIKLL